MPQSASATHTSFRPAGLVVQSFSYVAFAVSLAGAELARALAFIRSSAYCLALRICNAHCRRRFGFADRCAKLLSNDGALCRAGLEIKRCEGVKNVDFARFQISHPFRGAVLKLAFLPGVGSLRSLTPGFYMHAYRRANQDIASDRCSSTVDRQRDSHI